MQNAELGRALELATSAEQRAATEAAGAVLEVQRVRVEMDKLVAGYEEKLKESSAALHAAEASAEIRVAAAEEKAREAGRRAEAENAGTGAEGFSRRNSRLKSVRGRAKVS